GLIGLMVRHMGYSSDISSRVSIMSISLFFIAGATLLYFVDEERDVATQVHGSTVHGSRLESDED
ncbi:MAG: hypothetical protein K8R28_04225, partial [Desulfobacterales bacterium]|nr:hypothetical protein [Desulfobacterales bacterium]